MSLSTTLTLILGATLTPALEKEVMNAINARNSMKRYLASEKGKIAHKKANDTYYQKHKGNPKGDASDVLSHLNEYFKDLYDLETATLGATDLLTFSSIKIQTATELWKQYCADKPLMTRVRYISYLPAMETVSTHMRKGKKIHSPAFKIDLQSYAH